MIIIAPITVIIIAPIMGRIHHTNSGQHLVSKVLPNPALAPVSGRIHHTRRWLLASSEASWKPSADQASATMAGLRGLLRVG